MMCQTGIALVSNTVSDTTSTTTESFHFTDKLFTKVLIAYVFD